MAELANALDVGIVPSLPAPFKFAGGGVRRRIHGLVLLPSNSSDKSQSQSGYYRMNDGGKGQGNKRVDRDRNLPPTAGDPLTDKVAVGDPPQAAKRSTPQTTSEKYFFMAASPGETVPQSHPQKRVGRLRLWGTLYPQRIRC
jgi:hypothetical protein